MSVDQTLFDKKPKWVWGHKNPNSRITHAFALPEDERSLCCNYNRIVEVYHYKESETREQIQFVCTKVNQAHVDCSRCMKAMRTIARFLDSIPWDWPENTEEAIGVMSDLLEDQGIERVQRSEIFTETTLKWLSRSWCRENEA